MPTPKIATCTYCGTRAALVLNGEKSHELACSSCGAPLHDLKRLKTGDVDPEAHRLPKRGKKGHRKSTLDALDLVELALRKPKKSKKKKKKSGARKILDEAFDLFDLFD